MTDPRPIKLKPKRHFPFLARHPWVHAHSVGVDTRDFEIGEVVDVTDSTGRFVGRGLVNPRGKLRVRLYVFDPGSVVDEGLFCRRIDAAVARRRLVSPIDPAGGERLVYSESDLISGLIVDRYADCLSVSLTSLALARHVDAIIDHLQTTLSPRAIVCRMDDKTWRLEHGGPGVDSGGDSDNGFGGGAESLSRTVGELPPGGVAYRAGGLTFRVDLSSGQKTGGYLDQHDNHAAAARYMAGRRVLDVCCYHGGFALAAAAAGATRVTGLDASRGALETADAAAKENGLPNVDFLQGDCFDVLEDMAADGQTFDAVILDPPRLAGSRKQIESSLRAYHRLNASAVDLMPGGGILVTCSCSGRVSESDFLKMLSDVGRRRGRDMIVMECRGASADHPVAVSCPESRYLKCVILAVGPRADSHGGSTQNPKNTSKDIAVAASSGE